MVVHFAEATLHPAGPPAGVPKGKMMIRLAIPLPPPGNNFYRNVSTAERQKAAIRGKKLPGRVKSEKAKAWEEAAGWAVRADQSARGWCVSGRYGFALSIRPEVECDIDAVLKASLDLFVKLGLTGDDKNCWLVLLERSLSVPKMDEGIVTIWEISE